MGFEPTSSASKAKRISKLPHEPLTAFRQEGEALLKGFPEQSLLKILIELIESVNEIMETLWYRVKLWATKTDERFYYIFLLSCILFFGVLSIFNILAVGALSSSVLFLLFYETIMKKKL